MLRKTVCRYVRGGLLRKGRGDERLKKRCGSGKIAYGAREAAEFYFNKRPSQLTAEESIFLASIVPKPKHFRSSFTATGQLKENQAGYYRLITRRLVKKGLLTEEEGEAILPVIELNGPAKKFFVTDSIAISSEEPVEN